MKEAKLNPSSHLTLETLVEAAVSLQPPEASQDIINPPKTEPTEEESWAEKPDRTVLEVAQEFLKNMAFSGLGGCWGSSLATESPVFGS